MNLAHFAIHADDVERARSFYTSVFGWQFNAFGPPGFYQIQTGPEEDPGVRGAVQSRDYTPEDMHVAGFECTISVPSLEETIGAVEAAGGRTVLGKSVIPGVGWLAKFVDTEGNLVVAMQYDNAAA